MIIEIKTKEVMTMMSISDLCTWLEDNVGDHELKIYLLDEDGDKPYVRVGNDSDNK